jgi:hypothetical protein
MLLISGLTTILHTFLGSRLPLIQGSSFVYLAPALVIANSEEFRNLSDNVRFNPRAPFALPAPFVPPSQNKCCSRFSRCQMLLTLTKLIYNKILIFMEYN